MQYYRHIALKDGRDCCLRNGTEQDGAAVLRNFLLTHDQTDWLLTYPEECRMTEEQEGQFLKEKTENSREIEILAEVDGKVVGTAGIGCVGNKVKVRHRAELGVSVEREYWRLGIGRALLAACIECAKAAGYLQLELSMVDGNTAAEKLYKSVGFVEYGRNPKGFRSRLNGWQTVVLMRLDLELD